MTLMALLIRLRAAGVRIDPEGDKLRVDGPAGFVTAEVREALVQHKEALLHLPEPRLTPSGILLTPCLAAPQHHWEPVVIRLMAVGASPEIWKQYTSEPYPTRLTTTLNE